MRKPVSKEWLEEKYVAEGLDCVQIGRIVGRDPKSVWSWLRSYGIQTRPRGANHAHLPKDGSAFRGRKHSAATRERIRSVAIANGRVPFDPAVGSYMKGRRGKDAPGWKGGVTPERQAFYTSPEWKAACVSTWHRADAKCERCGLDHRTVDRSNIKFHVHHIVSFQVRELRAEPSNLVLLCGLCHRFVHGKGNTAREFIKEAPCP